MKKKNLYKAMINMDQSKKIDYSAFSEAGFYRLFVKAGIFVKKGIL